MSVATDRAPAVATIPGPGPKRRKSRDGGQDTTSLTGHSKLAPYVFSAPAIIIVSLLLAYPVLYGIYDSFFTAKYLGAPKDFVGIDNYVKLWHNPKFWDALWKSAYFVGGCVVLQLVLGLLFAFALNRVARSLRLLRSMVIAPYIISNVAAAVMFRLLFNADFGLLNRVLEFFGLPGQSWLADPNAAMLVVIVCQVWTDLPLTILIMLAGLQSIDSSYTDAALVDGAGPWQRARYLSMPLIAPQIAISTIWASYSTLTGLGVVLALTGGGPLKATETLPMQMYDTAFKALEFHDALAIATVILVLNAILTLMYVAVSRRFGEGE
jgi:ABC-type sugar transport system permease subunit